MLSMYILQYFKISVDKLMALVGDVTLLKLSFKGNYKGVQL